MIGLAGLSLERAPPLWVPMPFLVVAPLFATLFALILITDGPVVMSRWSPTLIGATHLLVLGYVMMVMFGAVQQMLPVVAGSPIPRGRGVALLLFGLLALGTPILGLGLMALTPWAIGLGGGLVVISILLFIASASISLARSPAHGPTITALWLAVFSLLATLLLGAWLATGYLGLGWSLPRTMTNPHLAWGLIGWVGLLIAGVAYQVVPMFQMTPEYPAAFARLYAPFVVIQLLLQTGATLWPAPPWTAVLGALATGLAALALAAFAVVTLRLQAQRRRRVPDVTLTFWRIGLLALLGAILLWGIGSLAPALGQQSVWPLMLAWLFVVGFAISIINGMLYKIVPFLVWLHLNQIRGRSPQPGGPRVPSMHEIITPRRAHIQLILHLIGLLAGLVALVWSPLWKPALLAFAASNVLLTWNLTLAIERYRVERAA
ncbi:hypothetical protein ABC977_15940 [Thioalkalicoccus limnaeus]|uniref:Permease n=1 Tax=Thioalkalicoccus limnaeus TaxID=120681 RepID=A0ABV4BH86_9GAMM